MRQWGTVFFLYTADNGGIGTTFQRWGPGPIMTAHRFGSDPEKNYGSYGINWKEVRHA